MDWLKDIAIGTGLSTVPVVGPLLGSLYQVNQQASRRAGQARPNGTGNGVVRQEDVRHYGVKRSTVPTQTVSRPALFSNPYAGSLGRATAYAAQAGDIQRMLGGLQGTYDSRNAALSGMFNFGEDPNAVAARDWALQNLAAQRDAANAAIATAYQGGIDSSQRAAAEALALGAAQGQALAEIYSSGAAGVQAANNAVAAQVAEGAGALGVTGPVEGDAVDLGAVLAAAAPREQALAQQLGQIGANTQNALATSMAGQRAAEQGSMQRAAAAMQGDIAAEYARREAERIAAERAAYRDAQMALQSEMSQRQMALEEALTNSRLDTRLAATDQLAMARQYDIEQRNLREQAMADIFNQAFLSELQTNPNLISGMPGYSAYKNRLLSGR